MCLTPETWLPARPSLAQFVDGTFQEILRRTEKSTGKRAEREPVIKGVRGLGRHTRGCDRLLGGRSGVVPIPFARLELSPVALWWITGGKELKGSTPTFFGVAVTV